MHQALWIFRKDVHHLRIQIAITLALQCIFTIFNILSSPLAVPETAKVNSIATWSSVFLVLSWWYLLALNIHEEALPGTRQFWVTRPYSWHSLLTAKILFAFTFINVPMVISDCVILGAQQFPVVRNIPAILLRQIPFSLLFIVPAFVCAALTSGIPQLLMALLAVAAGWLLEVTIISGQRGAGVSVDVISGTWLGEWIATAVFFVIAFVIVGWEYRTRRTTPVRSFSVALLLLAPFWSAMPLFKVHNPAIFSSRTPLPLDTALIQLGPRIASKFVYPNPSSVLEINVPMSVTGLPSETTLDGVERALLYRRPGQNHFEALDFGAFLTRRPDGYWLSIRIDPRRYKQIRSEPIILRATLELTLITAKPVVEIPASSEEEARVMNLGNCGLITEASLLPPGVVCRAALWIPQRTEIQVKSQNALQMSVGTGGSFENPFPIMKGLSPVDKWFVPLTTSEIAENQSRAILQKSSSQVIFVPQYSLGHFERTVEISGIRLENYDSSTGAKSYW